MDTFSFTEIVAIVSLWCELYFLLGRRSLFLRSVWGWKYIEGEAHFDSCTQGCVQDEIFHSNHSPNLQHRYLLLDLISHRYLVSWLTSRNLCNRILRLRWVVIIVPHGTLFKIYTTNPTSPPVPQLICSIRWYKSQLLRCNTSFVHC